jgi:hypothetical protein
MEGFISSFEHLYFRTKGVSNSFFRECFISLSRWISVATHLFRSTQNSFQAIFGNLLFLAGFIFQGHYEGLNEGFSRYMFSMIAKYMIDPPKCISSTIPFQ